MRNFHQNEVLINLILQKYSRLVSFLLFVLDILVLLEMIVFKWRYLLTPEVHANLNGEKH